MTRTQYITRTLAALCGERPARPDEYHAVVAMVDRSPRAALRPRNCLPPGERTGGRMCRDEMTDLEVFDIINKGLDDDAKNLLDFKMQCLDADLHDDPHRFDGIARLLHVDFGNTKDEHGQDALSGISKEELADLLRKANRRRKAAERTVRKMRDTIRRINDDAMTAISSRQRTIEILWEVMRELHRRGLVSTEDLETVLKAVEHVAKLSHQKKSETVT